MSLQQPVSRRHALAALAAASAGTVVAPSSLEAGVLGMGMVAQPPADFSALLSQTGVPSFAMARVTGDTIETEALGVTRAGTTDAATADTVYAAASLTKMLVAYIALDLTLAGAFTLDQPLRDLVPLPNPEDPRASLITARRLLSHTSGWPNWRNTPTPPMLASFEPGARWQYSGEGFFYLARVIEHVTDKPLGLVLRERLLMPLGMTRTSFVTLEALEPFLAAPHDGRGNVMVPYGRALLVALRQRMVDAGKTLEDARVADVEQAFQSLDANATRSPLPNFLNPNAAASLLTTANDFGKFVRHIATAPKAGGRPAAIVQLMLQPQVRCNPAVQWGLGVGLERIGARDHAWQWGDNPGYKNYVSIDPQGAAGVVIFTNGDRGARVYERVLRARLGVDRPGFLWA